MNPDLLLYTLAIFTFIVIFGFCYILRVYTYFEKRKIPKISTPSFPVGNVYDVIFQNVPMFMQLWKYYNRFKRRKCNFGGFFIFLKPAIIGVDQNFINSVCEKSDNYEEIQEYRSQLRNDVKAKILTNILCTNFINLCLEDTENEINMTAVLSMYYEKFYVNSICSSEYFRGDKVKGIFYRILERGVLFNVQKLFYICYPWMSGIFDNDNNDKNVKIITPVIEEIIGDRKKNDILENDVLQILISDGYSSKETSQIILNLVNNLHKAGNLILLTLFELSVNKDVQEELRDEIVRFNKYKTLKSANELAELVYLETVICETLRKYPIKPFCVKITKNKITKGSTTIEKNLPVFISTSGIHHNPENYTNPENFDPDRFSEENEKFIRKNTYLPFGFSGQTDFDNVFIKVMMKLMIFQLLSIYEFTLGKRTEKILDFEESSFDLKLKSEMWFKIKPV